MLSEELEVSSSEAVVANEAMTEWVAMKGFP